jgi:plasmid stabilization system protein ParE
MVRKIVWTPQAKIDRYEILDYYFKQGTPKKTLKLLDLKLREVIKLIPSFPLIGKPFGKHSERAIYKYPYCVVYELLESDILILHVWDTRRNPEDFKYK